MLKVIFTIDKWKIGGRRRVLMNLLDNLDKNKFDIRLLIASTNPDQDPPLPDLPVKTLQAKRYRGLILPIARYLRQEKPDVIISHYGVLMIPTLALAMLLSRAKPKFIIVHHGSPDYLAIKGRAFSHWFNQKLIRFFHHRADQVVAVCGRLADYIRKKYSLPGNKITHIYNGVVGDSLRAQAREKLDQPLGREGEAVILTVSRLFFSKDFPTLFQAFQKVRDKKPARLVIVGDGKDRNKLEGLAQEMGLADKIDFLGSQDNPYKYLANADVCVLSSETEGLPTVPIEAMASGCPIISTDCEFGTKEIITHKKNGLLVPVGDAEKMSEAILEVLSDGELRQKLIANGRERAQDFTVDKSVRQWEKLFENI
jgi:glycosyltransferase involved in cell wall biosynthesis